VSAAALAPQAPAEGPITPIDPVVFLVQAARTNYAAFITAVHRPRFKHSAFSADVCRAIDQFVDDVLAGKRPVLMLTAPPQHGKSSLISRCLAPYLFGRLIEALPRTFIAGASYAQNLARRFTREVKAIMQEPIYRAIFPRTSLIGVGGVSTSDQFDVPAGEARTTSEYRGVGIGGPLTGMPLHILIIDDSVKNAQEALSPVVQESREAWFDSVAQTRMQEISGTVLIGTPWSANDLLARVRRKFKDDARFKLLSFPALNHPGESGYRDDLPEGALVPHLHSETKLREMKAHISAFWWSAMFQQLPMAEYGATFKRDGLRYYRRAELPAQFTQVIISVDATFKDGAASDYVAAGVWGKSSDDRVWLIAKRRERLAFMATATAIIDLKKAHPRVSRSFIEDAANGAALVDMLKKHIPSMVGVPPMGSKEARAHAVSWVWDAGQVMLPHPDEDPSIATWVDEITSFPDTTSGHDDTVDCMTIALHQLCLRSPIAALITNDILRAASL
jgi:predicted phage terminase large subunit-like protein